MQVQLLSVQLARTTRESGERVSLLRKWLTTEQEQGRAALPGQKKQNLPPEQQEIRRLRKENEILRYEREIQEKLPPVLGRTDAHEDACPLLCQRNHTLRYRFTSEHRSKYPLDVRGPVLNASVSGDHSWQRRPVSNQQRIREIYQLRKGRYGAPRIHAEVWAEGIRISRKRVARPMRTGGLRARGERRWVRATDSAHPFAVRPNLLDRQFDVQLLGPAHCSQPTTRLGLCRPVRSQCVIVRYGRC